MATGRAPVFPVFLAVGLLFLFTATCTRPSVYRQEPAVVVSSWSAGLRNPPAVNARVWRHAAANGGHPQRAGAGGAAGPVVGRGAIAGISAGAGAGPV